MGQDRALDTEDTLKATAAAYERSAEELAPAYVDWPPAGADTDLVELATNGVPLGATVVDVGCASGRNMLTLTDRGYVAIGADRSVAMMKPAAEAGPAVVTDACSLPLRSASADGVLALASVHHLPRSGPVQTAFAECLRVLRPTGRLVLSMLATAVPFVDRYGRYFEAWPDDELDAALVAAGFVVIHAQLDVDRRRSDLRWHIRVAQPDPVREHG